MSHRLAISLTRRGASLPRQIAEAIQRDVGSGRFRSRELLGAGASRARVDTAALVLWSGVHGYASLVIDGAIRPSRADRARQVTALLDRMLGALG